MALRNSLLMISDNKIAIIVPTQDRSVCVKSYIEAKIEEYSACGIELIFFDSSADQETKCVVDYYKKNNHKIKYDIYNGEAEQNAIDKKVCAACMKYSSIYDYIILSSDRTIINIEKMKHYIKNGAEKEVDFFVYDNGEEYCNEYTSAVELLKDWGWRITSLSSVIFSSRFLEKMMKIYKIEDNNELGLWLMSAIFFTIANLNFKAMVFCSLGLWDKNTNGIISFWKSSGNAIWQWSCVWCRVIDALPEKYDKIKARAILSHDEKTGIFSYNELLNFKKNGNLTIKIVNNNAKYICRSSCVSLVWFYAIAIFPERFSEGIIRRIYQFLKRNGLKA